jgi:hypothetical protein
MQDLRHQAFARAGFALQQHGGDMGLPSVSKVARWRSCVRKACMRADWPTSWAVGSVTDPAPVLAITLPSVVVRHPGGPPRDGRHGWRKWLQMATIVHRSPGTAQTALPCPAWG